MLLQVHDSVIFISIHALVKRATCPLAWALHVADISIHALVKRATGDTSGFIRIAIISIHALVKRATIRGG